MASNPGGDTPSQRHARWPQTVAGAVMTVWMSTAPTVQIAQAMKLSLSPGSAPYTLGVVLPSVIGMFLGGSVFLGPSRVRWNVWIAAPIVVAGISVLSTFWSDFPDFTANVAWITLGVVGAGVWFAMELMPHERMVALALGSQPLVVLSVGRELASPSHALGGWVGVFGSRNMLAPMALLGLMTAAYLLYLWRQAIPKATVVVGLVMVDLLALVGARSRTAVVAGLLAAMLGWAVTRKGVGGQLSTVAKLVLGGLAVGAASLLIVGTTTRSLDRPLSYRSAVWRHVIEAWSNRPIGGYGYIAVWFDKTVLDPLYIESGLVFDNAHNSAIEMLVATGLVGFLGVIITQIGAVWRPITAWLRLRDPASLIWVVIATFCAVENLTEAFIVYHSVFWMLVVAAAATSAHRVVPRTAATQD